MSTADIKKNAEAKMTKSVDALKSELQKIRTGRAHPGILDQVHVDYYGSPVPISQVANVTLLDARTISVQPWEKGMGAKIEKAIRESDLGLNPSAQGDLLRVPMPPLTEERVEHFRARPVLQRAEARMHHADHPALAHEAMLHEAPFVVPAEHPAVDFKCFKQLQFTPKFTPGIPNDG